LYDNLVKSEENTRGFRQTYSAENNTTSLLRRGPAGSKHVCRVRLKLH